MNCHSITSQVPLLTVRQCPNKRRRYSLLPQEHSGRWESSRKVATATDNSGEPLNINIAMHLESRCTILPIHVKVMGSSFTCRFFRIPKQNSHISVGLSRKLDLSSLWLKNMFAFFFPLANISWHVVVEIFNLYVSENVFLLQYVCENTNKHLNKRRTWGSSCFYSIQAACVTTKPKLQVLPTLW